MLVFYISRYHLCYMLSTHQKAKLSFGSLDFFVFVLVFVVYGRFLGVDGTEVSVPEERDYTDEGEAQVGRNEGEVNQLCGNEDQPVTE